MLCAFVNGVSISFHLPPSPEKTPRILMYVSVLCNAENGL